MESVHKLEQTVAGWFARAPHLPPKGAEWLANNVWWIVLIAVVLGGLSVFMFFSLILFGLTFTMGMGYGTAAGGVLAVLATTWALVGIVFFVIEALAVAPLKAGNKRGWDLLFLGALLQAVITIMSFMLTFNLAVLLEGVLGLAIGGYFLFEIRGYFAANHAPNHNHRHIIAGSH